MRTSTRIVVLSKKLWTPAQLTTVLWLDAADTSTITLNGTTASKWRDKSGNDNHATQATPANQPTYQVGQNGLNILTFNGSNWLAVPNTVNPSGASAVFAVCKPDHSQTFAVIISRAFNWGSWYLRSASTGTSADYSVGRNGIDQVISSVTGLTNATNKIITGVHDNINVSISVDGRSLSSTAYTHNPTYNASDATTIGAFRNTNDTTASLFRGDMYEITVIHSAPSQDTVHRMQGHYAHKWGLTSGLAANHPYKTSPPYV
jgi:hypothetical protein